MTRTSRYRQHGMSLVEALVAFAISAIGMMALVSTETGLRMQADLTRQRTEAVRLAQQEVERLRSFASMEQFLDLPQQAGETVVDPGSSTRFTLVRSFDAQPAPGTLSMQVAVRWQDRSGQQADVDLRSIIAGLEPALSGRLVTRASNGSFHHPRGRSVFIPLEAVDMGDGHSRFTPRGASGIAWVFDNASGWVTSVCSITSDAEHCVAASGLLVSGHVRFSTDATVTADDAAHPAGHAMNLDMLLLLAQGTATCFDDAGVSIAATDVTYHCLVTLPPGSTRWSGRLDVQPLGWLLGHDARSYRVCRYSADTDGRPGIANAEHPLDYQDVDAPLLLIFP